MRTLAWWKQVVAEDGPFPEGKPIHEGVMTAEEWAAFCANNKRYREEAIKARK